MALDLMDLQHLLQQGRQVQVENLALLFSSTHLRFLEVLLLLSSRMESGLHIKH
jgi:hypothetical protein